MQVKVVLIERSALDTKGIQVTTERIHVEGTVGDLAYVLRCVLELLVAALHKVLGKDSLLCVRSSTFVLDDS